MRREGALAHSFSAARLATPRHDATRVAGMSRAELIPTSYPRNQITSASRVRSLNCCCRRRLRPATLSRLPRTRSTGEQASETSPLRFLYGRGAIRFLGSDHATARLRPSASSTSASLSSSPVVPARVAPP